MTVALVGLCAIASPTFAMASNASSLTSACSAPKATTTVAYNYEVTTTLNEQGSCHYGVEAAAVCAPITRYEYGNDIRNVGAVSTTTCPYNDPVKEYGYRWWDGTAWKYVW